MTQHDTLGFAGCARGIDDGCQIIRITVIAPQWSPGLGQPVGGHADTWILAAVVDGFKREDAGQRTQFIEDRFHALPLLLALQQ